MVNASGAGIWLSSRYDSPVMVGFGYSFGRSLYVLVDLSIHTEVVAVSSSLLGISGR